MAANNPYKDERSNVLEEYLSTAIIPDALERLQTQREPTDTYITNYNASRIILAFARYQKPYEEMSWKRRRNYEATGPIEHVELWFQKNQDDVSLACSAVVGRGAFLWPRDFKKDDRYQFYEIRISKREEDLLLVAANAHRGEKFNHAMGLLLWLPPFFSDLYKHCCFNGRNRDWICSQLIFVILDEAGVLNRILGITHPIFQETDRTLGIISATELFNVLNDSGKLIKCANQSRPLERVIKTYWRGEYLTYGRREYRQ